MERMESNEGGRYPEYKAVVLYFFVLDARHIISVSITLYGSLPRVSKGYASERYHCQPLYCSYDGLSGHS